MAMNEAYFKKLANDIMLDLSAQEIKELQAEFMVFEKQIAKLNLIDTNNVAEMVFPFDEETSFLRDDVVDVAISQDAALANVSNSKLGQFWVPKVVK